ncbi:MAG: purine-nucleoside phosphorylase [Bacteriovoracia bacterium]
MSEPSIYQKIKLAAEYIRSRSKIEPKAGIVLGSGLGALADEVTDREVIPYGDIPGFHGTSVEGHAGQMILGQLEGVPVVLLSGRFHAYEGYPMETVVFPTRVVCALGIQTLVLTNAAGGVNTRYRPCDLMIIEDHINFMGDNPLKGPHLTELGPRFPDMTEAYNKECIAVLVDNAKRLDIPVHTGVYAALMGPTYETPAEVRMLRALGADAVGMSTVPESIAANHLGVQVAGISCITNLAAGITPNKLTHDEVIENSRIASRKLRELVKTSIPQLIKTRR